MSKKPLKLNKSAAVVHKWLRFQAIGCSHGKHICPKAREAALAFKESFKPDLTIHLGDAIDTAAFRSGARGIDADSAEPVAPDIDGGLMFLKELRPDVFLCGNHEARLWHLQSSPNAVIAYASHKAIQHIEDGCAKIGTRIIPYDAVWQEYKRADITFMHGVMFSENATRDHCEAFGPGKVVHAHTHRAAYATGRTRKNSEGFCVGTLARKREMTYASTRKQTLAWSQGIVAGEFREGRNPASQVWLFTGPSEGEDHGWRLPF